MTKNRRSWRNLWCERRNRDHHKMLFALLLFCLAWVGTVFAASSLTEHADEIMSFEWKLILGAIGIIQALIGYIYISGINSVKKSISALFDRVHELEKEKLSKEDHEILCEKVRE